MVIGMSREEMDRVVNEHFGYEARDDVEGVLASLADEVEHDIIPSRDGILDSKEEIRARYESLFAAIKGESVKPLRRYYGDGFLVDESLWKGEVVDGSVFLCDGRSGPVCFRLLHVFELKDGRIARDGAAGDVLAAYEGR